MTIQTVNHGRVLAALVMACALAAFTVEPATAQTAKKLKCNGCVKTKHLKNGGVRNADLGNNSVNGAKIADGTVGTADLATNAVTSAKIANGTVGNADLANDSVDSSKVQDNSLTSADLGPNSVGASEIATNAVGQSEIATNGVGAAEIATSAVGSSEVQGNSIPATDMSNEAGVDFSTVSGTVTLPANGSNIIVRTLTLSAPSAGYAVATATAQFFKSGAGTGVGRCGISQNATQGSQVVAVNLASPIARASVANTVGFVIPAGSNVFNFVCDQNTGNGIVMGGASLTVIFAPTRY